MTQEQLIEEIKRLPLAKRLELLKAVSRDLREEFREVGAVKVKFRQLSAADRVAITEIMRNLNKELEPRKDSQATSLREPSQVDVQGSDQSTTTLSQRLRGILKFAGEPPTDEEIKDAYADYLLEKYS